MGIVDWNAFVPYKFQSRKRSRYLYGYRGLKCFDVNCILIFFHVDTCMGIVDWNIRFKQRKVWRNSRYLYGYRGLKCYRQHAFDIMCPSIPVWVSWIEINIGICSSVLSLSIPVWVSWKLQFNQCHWGLNCNVEWINLFLYFWASPFLTHTSLRNCQFKVFEDIQLLWFNFFLNKILDTNICFDKYIFYCITKCVENKLRNIINFLWTFL